VHSGSGERGLVSRLHERAHDFRAAELHLLVECGERLLAASAYVAEAALRAAHHCHVLRVVHPPAGQHWDNNAPHWTVQQQDARLVLLEAL